MLWHLTEWGLSAWKCRLKNVIILVFHVYTQITLFKMIIFLIFLRFRTCLKLKIFFLGLTQHVWFEWLLSNLILKCLRKLLFYFLGFYLKRFEFSFERVFLSLNLTNLINQISVFFSKLNNFFLDFVIVGWSCSHQNLCLSWTLDVPFSFDFQVLNLVDSRLNRFKFLVDVLILLFQLSSSINKIIKFMNDERF